MYAGIPERKVSVESRLEGALSRGRDMRAAPRLEECSSQFEWRALHMQGRPLLWFVGFAETASLAQQAAGADSACSLILNS